MGEIGEHGTVGDHVQAGGDTAWWVVVERYATIGSRARIHQPPVALKSVKIFAHAKVPDATVIDEAYCQQHPTICTFY
jgi:hypothetical protein